MTGTEIAKEIFRGYLYSKTKQFDFCHPRLGVSRYILHRRLSRIRCSNLGHSTRQPPNLIAYVVLSPASLRTSGDEWINLPSLGNLRMSMVGEPFSYY